MKVQKNFSKKLYMIIALVLMLGIMLQFSRSQYVLKFQINESLARQATLASTELPKAELTELEGSNYCVISNEKEEYSKKLSANAIKSLEYMQKKTVAVDINVEQPDLTKCEVVILATNEIINMGTPEEIEQFVYGGGYIFFMSYLEINSEYQLLYRLFGVTSFGDFVETKGVHLTSNVLIGEKDLLIENEFLSNVSVTVDLDDEAELLAESEKKIPLLWRREYGQGAFMTFNSTLLSEKMNRGFFTGALSMLEPNFIYTIFNSKVFFIDDFPAPIAYGKNETIYEEYKLDTPSFFRDIWWPNMLKASKKYDMKYTGAVIESYNDRVIPPFNNSDDIEGNSLISYGREIIKSGGELAFHGYNHQSLVLDTKVSDKFGYNAWKSEEDMTEAIDELVNYAKTAFPSYTVTAYVPPSNVLSSTGRAALKNGWPDLTVISSLYGEDEENLAYVQEFEIAQDNILEMPRITSGYYDDIYNHWAEANTMTGLGVFSHFIHPDDVISSDRGNNMGWEELYLQFNQYMDRVHETYPWIRPMTATEAALDMRNTLQTKVNWRVEENSVSASIANYQTETSYIFRTDKKVKRLHHCEALKIDDNVYLVTAKSSEFKIELE
ncbi:DUF2194 domain-containing protein [Psychrobacillus antarcticus]|uniref:DUF2194 domain-containing protein n=1 Tax=Psychrobacillus antarcticus TaxID=2879115 RepID=UPI002408801D|nr:DUF2194 domain-containing protein [Psychrobacillus antarcticus]